MVTFNSYSENSVCSRERSERARDIEILVVGSNLKVLVIGANGQLGSELCRKGEELGGEMVPMDLPELDITQNSAARRAVCQPDISLVINAAAYTAVDKAESEPKHAFAVNCDGPAHLATCCANLRIPLIHISTDYVFDGNKAGAYIETDPVCPIGVYGRSKASGEEEIRKKLTEHVIIRTSWLYGVHGNNFVKTMLRLGSEKEVVRVIDDQHGCPTYAGDLAEAILSIARDILERKEIHWGTYHYCGKGETTWYGFAERIFQVARRHRPFPLRCVEAITTEQYPTPAKRPRNSVLDCARIKEVFGIEQRPWEESLERAIPALLNND